MYPPRSRARLHAPSRKRAWGVQGAVHAFARLHAQEDSRSLTAVKVARRLKPGRSNASRRARYGKVLISSGIWRTISENPHQKMSKYSPNLTKYKHTKRARVQPKRGGDTPPTPPKTTKMARKGGERVPTPEIGCTPARFVCFQESGVRGSTRPQEIAIVWTGLHHRYRRNI